MFTGIVEQIGTIESVATSPEGSRLVFGGLDLGDLTIGGSVSVNGVCLTAVEISNGSVAVDVIPETLARSNLGSLRAGDPVNLERPMPASGRFDGHIVQGHVDGTGSVTDVERGDEGAVVTIAASPDVLRYVVEKGSITVDGVSLTVAGLTDGGFTVALIPHTLEVTTLGRLKPGSDVNLEVDVLAKYVERLLRPRE